MDYYLDVLLIDSKHVTGLGVDVQHKTPEMGNNKPLQEGLLSDMTCSHEIRKWIICFK